ncbi:MAG: hypothetical protein Q7R97_05415 [Candidatus Daviesbacteria bacterium]|nr:hypothetical protein [Candidatus Daviesbacteria bacterium]
MEKGNQGQTPEKEGNTITGHFTLPTLEGPISLEYSFKITEGVDLLRQYLPSVYLLLSDLLPDIDSIQSKEKYMKDLEKRLEENSNRMKSWRDLKDQFLGDTNTNLKQKYEVTATINALKRTGMTVEDLLIHEHELFIGDIRTIGAKRWPIVRALQETIKKQREI